MRVCCPRRAQVAASHLTCFGGKREAGEAPLACLVRELKEELGLNDVTHELGLQELRRSSPLGCGEGQAAAASGLRRAVDLYVDGKLIAWFFDAPAPSRQVRAGHVASARCVVASPAGCVVAPRVARERWLRLAACLLPAERVRL